MSLIRASALNVITIYCQDLDVSTDFYVNVLGMTLDRPLGSGRLLSFGHGHARTSVYLEGGRTFRRGPVRDTPSVSFCIAVEDGVRHACETLRRNGYHVSEEIDGDEFALIWVADPAGNLVEIAGRP